MLRVRELESLRYDEKQEEVGAVKSDTVRPLAEINGNTLEMSVVFKSPAAKEAGLDVLCDQNGENGLRIAYIPETKTLRVGKVNAPFDLKKDEDLVTVFKHTVLDLADKPEITQSGTQWRYDGPVLRSSAGPEPASAAFSVPEHYMLDCLVTMTPKSRLAMTIGGQHRLCLTPENGQLALTGPAFDRTRPCPVDISKPVKIQVFAEGKLIECFINDQFAQTCTVGTAKEKKLGITAEGGSVEILKLLVKTCQ